MMGEQKAKLERGTDFVETSDARKEKVPSYFRGESFTLIVHIQIGGSETVPRRRVDQDLCNVWYAHEYLGTALI